MALQRTQFFWRLTGGETKVTGGATIYYPINRSLTRTLNDGTGIGAAQKVVTIIDSTTSAYSVVTGSVSDINLTSLTGPFGTVNMTAVKGILLVNKAAATNTTHTITMFGATASAFVGPLGGSNQTLVVQPGAAVLLLNDQAGGWTTSSQNNLRLRGGAGTNSVSYDLHIIGLGS